MDRDDEPGDDIKQLLLAVARGKPGGITPEYAAKFLNEYEGYKTVMAHYDAAFKGYMDLVWDEQQDCAAFQINDKGRAAAGAAT